MLRTIDPISEEGGTILNSAWCSGGCSMSSSRLAKFCSKKVEQPMPTNRFPKAPRMGKGPCNDGLPLDSRCWVGNTEGKSNIEAMAQRVQNLFKSKNFYDQLASALNSGWPSFFRPLLSWLTRRRLEPRRAEPWEVASSRTPAWPSSGIWSQGLSSHHNRPLYVTACIRDIELRCAMVVSRSSLNILVIRPWDHRSVSKQDHEVVHQGFSLWRYILIYYWSR